MLPPLNRRAPSFCRNKDPDVTTIVKDRFISSTILDHRMPRNAPRLRRPGERRLSGKFVCVYARYSTPEQKQRSIDRQLERCARSHPEVAENRYLLFQDRGYSGTTLAKRPDLMEMLELVKMGVVSEIVVEAFDRLSRDIWDAGIIGEMLEVYGVKLHVANLGRAVTREELIDEAKRAEADKKRRWDLVSDGIYQLVRDGGVPWQKNFGFKEGEKRGFPVKCDVASKAVVRLFELARFSSDRCVANKLRVEGFISPNGTTKWTAGQVCSIRSNLLYIGVINYRKTNHERKRVLADNTPAPAGDLRVRTMTAKSGKGRPASEWIVGYNGDYQLVSDELFLAVAMARSSRRGNTRKSGASQSLFANPVCDCPGRDPNQKYLISWEPPATYRCSLDSSSASCHCQVGNRLLVEDVQRTAIEVLRKHAGPLCDDAVYRADFVERLQTRSDGFETKRAELKRKRDKLDRQADKLALDGAKSGFSDKRLTKLGAQLEEAIASIDSDIGRLPKIDPQCVDMDSAALLLSDAFDVINARIPFKPQDPNEEQVAETIHSIIKQVVVGRENLAVGRVGIEVTLDVEGYMLGQGPGSKEFLITDRKEIRIDRRFVAGTTTRAALEELAASGRYALTDEQWRIASPSVPDMSVQYGTVKEVMDTRRVADATVFKLRTGVGDTRLPAALGEPSILHKLIRRFTYAGGMATLVDVIGSHDPGWLDGLDVERIRRMRTGLDKGRSWAILRPEQSAIKFAAEKRFAISDVQYGAVKEFIDPVVLHPRVGPGRPFDERKLLDGIILKLRTQVSFNRMPPEWGDHKDLLGATIALVRTGGWKKILAVWRRDFPEILDGLPVEILDALGANYVRQHQKAAATFDRARQNLEKIYTNLEQLAGTATARPGTAMRRKGVRVRLKGQRHLRPDMVVGPERAISGSDFLQPTLIVRSTNSRQKAFDRRKALEYRSVSGAEHILLVYSDIMQVEHFEKKGGKWHSSMLKQPDAVIIAGLELSLLLRDIYANTET
jgi:DNA invertase Pin-like site-specific DNA recombinase